MTNDRDQALTSIEEGQAELRRSIERAKQLAAESERLIARRHKPPNPAAPE